MKAIIDFLTLHRAKATLVTYWIFTSAIHTMPHPAAAHGFYSWFYAFTHILAGGLLANGGFK
jgi:hypothetical protein